MPANEMVKSVSETATEGFLEKTKPTFCPLRKRNVTWILGYRNGANNQKMRLIKKYSYS